jgi:hypothetical protein
MPLQLPPPPNFNVNVPDLTQRAMEAGQLRALMSEQALRQQMAPGQLQLQQQQVQQAQLQNQMTQQQLASTKALQAAIVNGTYNKYVGVETSDGSGVDAQGLYQELVRNNVLPPQAGEAVNSFLTVAKNSAEIQKTLAQGGEAKQNIRIKTLDQVAAKLGSINDMKASEAGPALDAFKQDLIKNPGAYPGLSQLEMGHIYAADLGHLPAMESLLGLESKIADFHKSKAEAAKAQQGVMNPVTGLSPDVQQQVQKEIAVQTATQPLRMQTTLAEAKAKQLMEGMTRPGYAFNPATGQTQLTDQTQYLQSGGKLMGFRPITEKDVRDDTMLTNRLGDVHLKLQAYEEALKNRLSEKEKNDIAGLLGEGVKGATGAKVGFLGVGAVIPMARLDQLMDSASLAELGPNARDQLIAYKNMREAMIGYKTVLSGSARGSDKQMELLEAMVPSPAVTDRDYSQRSINAFRGNLNIVGQGLPQLPGIKGAADWEIEQRQRRQGFSRPQGSKVLQGLGFIGQ